MAFTRSSVRSRPAPPVLCPHRLVGLGHRPFTAATGVRIPLGTPDFNDWCASGGMRPRLVALVGRAKTLERIEQAIRYISERTSASA